ncbi:polysaccharide deacetylase family protein [Bacillus sp. FJAT-45037]|uniref:polysaccharide deacetylase family protein n=1 Tax=Bacillus sp. FJAT-45037 TaxID=2011007 RepID=UPI000C24578D|nr:polysaccharide deacetylase family protein [Bacillus sp. FJAT-45037]
MKKGASFIFLFGALLVITFGAVQNPFSLQYINELKQDSQMVMKLQDPLYEEIIAKKDGYEELAIDARLDPVWKAVPGYNGITVDVDASYDKMKKLETFSEERLVFKEVKPTVHLEELPPSPIYKGNEKKPMVSLLVNVAWGNEYIPDMLKVMDELGVKSTFFLDGSWVKKNPTMATMILEQGHEIGNHAYSHPDMKSLTLERMNEEFKKTNDVILATLDVTPKWFAPPSGSFSQTVVDQAREHGMMTILWSVDTVDWRKPAPDEMVNRVLEKMHSGAMVLMHPTEPTAIGLEDMIRGIQARGYELGTVSEVMSESRPHVGVTLDD